MKVSDAVQSRTSIRAYLNDPVPTELLKTLLQKSARAPSGGNLQPWKVFVLNNSSMSKFIDFQATWVSQADPQYEIYPQNLTEPYRSSRFELGEQMYELLGISREMKNERIAQVMKNFEFFGAPVGLFCYIDKQMGPPQWSDLGMFLQTFMLLCEEAGLSTCAQEAWSIKHDCVSAFLKIQNDDILFCGMSIGYKDDKDVINSLQSERRPIDEWATFI